jgi:hypothetical protein
VKVTRDSVTQGLHSKIQAPLAASLHLLAMMITFNLSIWSRHVCSHKKRDASKAERGPHQNSLSSLAQPIHGWEKVAKLRGDPTSLLLTCHYRNTSKVELVWVQL